MPRLTLQQTARTVYGWEGVVVAIEPRTPLSVALSHKQKRGKPFVSWYRAEEIIAK